MSAPAPPSPTYGSPRWMAIRATRALALGMFAMAAVAWIVTPYGVAGGLLLGVPVAVLAPRFNRLRTPLFLCVVLAVIGIQAGVFLFGASAIRSRFLAGLVATFAVAPWLVILTFVVWARSPRQSGGAS